MSLTDRGSLPATSAPAVWDYLAAERGELRLTLPLRHGGTPAVTLRYELIGEAQSVLLVAGGISAGRHVAASGPFPELGWWQAQAASLNLEHHRVLAIDWVGADGSLDQPIDAADQAEAIARLLDHLGIDRLHGFVGASYGGMVALHFAALHPRRCGGLLVISAAGDSHPFASACRSLQRRAIALGERTGNPEAGVALARALAILTYRSAEEFADRFAQLPSIDDGRVRVAADDYLDFQGRRHSARMSAAAYRRLSESIDLHRVAARAVRVPATFVAVCSDTLVLAADVEAFARAVPRASFRLIESRYGHDAFLKEEGQVAAIITEFLQSLETKP